MTQPAKREPVDYRHDALYPEFLNFMARMAGYAGLKYSNPLQYLGSRLKGPDGPINHAKNHIGEFQLGKPHDHFGADIRWHLVAAAYNLMMEFIYISFGHKPDTWANAVAEVTDTVPVVTGAQAVEPRCTRVSDKPGYFHTVLATAHRATNFITKASTTKTTSTQSQQS